MKYRKFPFALLSVCALALASATVDAQGIERSFFKPPKEKGPVVVIISGQTGVESRKEYAKSISQLGYYVVLVDGNDILDKARQGRRNLTEVLSTAVASEHANSKKAFVIGFSLGGGGILAHAIALPDLVVGAAAIYPFTSWIQNVNALVDRFEVPLLVLAAEKDTYKDCCLIAKAREIETVALAKSKPFEMIGYSYADHGFDLPGRAYRAGDTRDAWDRVVAMLTKLQPLP
jgi:dienelactone hydrolase